ELLAERRIQAIRDDLRRQSGTFIRIAAPWTATNSVPDQSVDWLFSHSVMEHVHDVEEAYLCCSRWMSNNGMMTHNIDYRSHNMTTHWNGHWTIDDLTWSLVRGRRPYLINRLPHSAHINLLKSHNFEIVREV